MQLKSFPEDFIVEEINTMHFDENGKYSYYHLKKINTDHNAALQIIACAFNINRKYINVAGVKDKCAITTQYLSISKGPKKNLKKDNIELIFLGTGRERLNLGMLDGNKFTITIRNIITEEMKNFEKNIEKQKDHFCIPNYYDDQRFGIHKNNHLIGKLLVKRQFKEAVMTIVKQEQTSSASLHLEKHPTDFIGALRTIPKQQLRMYIHSYQSFLWNETVKEVVKEKTKSWRSANYCLGELYFNNNKIKNEKIPIIGFEIEHNAEKITQIIEKVMKQENIKERDFIIREIPELSSSGGIRNILMDCTYFSYKTIDNEMLTIQFTLGKGSYATIVIKALFS